MISENTRFSFHCYSDPVLKRRYKLVILSNVHRDGIAASTRKLGVEFDAIYTAEALLHGSRRRWNSPFPKR